jgi:hypothetical protein
MLDQPDGVGELSLTRLTVKQDGLCCDFRGQVEGYGTVYASHRFVYDSKNESQGTLSGEARTFLEDGTYLTTPHRGSFVREGVVNFVAWTINLTADLASVRYWQLEGPGKS